MENLKKILFATIDYHTKGVDTYYNGGSMWLIFTDRKKWVIELTKDGTLWYNHYFFNDCFKYLSLDAVENQHYITKWVEDIIQNGVRSTLKYRYPTPTTLESIIQNGVKDTGRRGVPPPPLVEDIIQNGVRSTQSNCFTAETQVEDTIQNGLINTFGVDVDLNHLVEDTIQNGVKETDFYAGNLLYDVEDTIQNGVKHTEPGGYLGSIEMKGKIVHQLESPKQNEEVEDVIENGVKETKTPGDGDLLSTMEWMESNNTESVPEMIQDVITNSIKNTQPHVLEILNPLNFEPTFKENKRLNEINNVLNKGIKEVKELPDQSGELKGYGDYYHRQEDRTYPHTKTVDDVIRVGIKETKQEPPQRTWKISEVIKETNWRRVDNHPTYLNNILNSSNS
jgi:hypothetical protein